MAQVTIKEVAKAAGVSAASVSLVLNNKPLGMKLAPGTRERVRTVAKKMSYRPNILAQSLLSRKTKTIGFLCGDIHTPFYAELTSAMLDLAFIRGYRLMTMVSKWDYQLELECLADMGHRSVDGVVMFSECLDALRELPSILKGYDIPVVILASPSRKGGISMPFPTGRVVFNLRPGMEEALAHLANTGHKRLALAHDPNFPNVRDALRMALPKYSMETEEYHFSFGSECLREQVELCGREVARARPDAVIVASDYTAAILVSSIVESGMDVPDDISVISVDGTDWIQFYNPTLTSIQQNRTEMAAAAMEMLLEMVAGHQSLEEISIPTKLMVGKSVVSRRQAPTRSPEVL